MLAQARAELNRVDPYHADQLRQHGARVPDLRPYTAGILHTTTTTDAHAACLDEGLQAGCT